MLILDACRYDLFKEKNSLPGRLESRISKGSCTPEFVRSNFKSRNLKDTVYITSNPQYRRYDEISSNFHRIIDVWNDEDKWDDEIGTVPPKEMADAVRKYSEEYPDKRILAHFMQPHQPFLGNNSEYKKISEERKEGEGFWRPPITANIDVSSGKIWEEYEENLVILLPVLEELKGFLEGKTVVTSDHGNMFGERSFPIPHKEWGHPVGIYTEELVKVPWLVVEDDARREITREDSNNEKTKDEEVKDRLQDLGYAS